MFLATVSDHIVLLAVLIVLALATCRTEVALLAFSSTSHTWRVVGIVNAAQVAADFSSPARNTSLVNTLVLARLCGICGLGVRVLLANRRSLLLLMGRRCRVGGGGSGRDGVLGHGHRRGRSALRPCLAVFATDSSVSERIVVARYQPPTLRRRRCGSA